MEKALKKWNKKNVWNNIKTNWSWIKWIPGTPLWCPWKKCVTFRPSSILLILFLVVQIKRGYAYILCSSSIYTFNLIIISLMYDYNNRLLFHVFNCCRQTSDPWSGFSTVEKEVLGSLTPMLGDRNIGSFELNIIFLFSV